MILVVEDDTTLRRLVSELLEGRGYAVRTAADGAEAYRWVHEPGCRGLVLDFHMPGVNGPELLLLMASEGVCLPVLLTTSDHDFDEAEMRQFPNVRRLLYKPLVPEEILSAVEEHMGPPEGGAAG